MPHTVDQAAPDTGIACLSHIARLHGIPVDAGQLRHQYGPRGKPLDSIDLLRAALRPRPLAAR
ncbi:MAG: cysteine peptidase family C39 domain-containing protein, partial [Pseudomonadota bacterium]|nr:cysteine peptidase family C39 domain-containing protein [Pseudomonadota bacterium]